jgi:FlaG/FlaF family flagellin (archaellin)
MNVPTRDQRSVSSVLGTVLLVAVVVIIASVTFVGALAVLDGFGTPTANASFDFEESPAGLVVRPTALGTDVVVELNGRPIDQISSNEAGKPVLVPTAPGDTVTIVSKDGERSVLISREIDDRSEVGDLIAYYPFEDTGQTLSDRSGNANDATLTGDTGGWRSGSYEFTGDDYFEVADLNTPVSEVSEFTIAVAYRTDAGDSKQELVEHRSGTDNWGVEIKECGPDYSSCAQSTPDTYNPNFFADENSGSQNGQIFGGTQQTGQQNVIVGTYNGSSTNMYVDGEFTSTRQFSSEINMGQFFVGTDAENAGNSDNLDGRIYEIRLYYTAFDKSEVKRITTVMAP